MTTTNLMCQRHLYWKKKITNHKTIKSQIVMLFLKNLLDEKIEMGSNIKKLYFGIYLMFGNCILDFQYSTYMKIPVEPINYDKIPVFYFTLVIALMW